MMSAFKIKWSAQDGYLSGGRPQTTEIEWGDWGPTDEESVREAVLEAVDDDFANTVTPGIDNLDDAVASGLAWIREREREERSS